MVFYDGRGGKDRGHGKTEAHRVLPGPVDQILQKKDADVVEHQRNDDFVGLEMDLEQGRNQPADAAGQGRGEKHGWQEQICGPVGKGKHNPGGPDGSHGVLSFGTDIPDLEPESHRDAKAAQKDGHGFNGTVFQGVQRTKGALEQQA